MTKLHRWILAPFFVLVLGGQSGCFVSASMIRGKGTRPDRDLNVKNKGSESVSCGPTCDKTRPPKVAPTASPSKSPTVAPTASPSKSSEPSAAPSRFQGWETITYDNFEDPDDDGWGNFRTSTDDNELAKRVDSSLGSDFIPNGNAALRIEDDRGWRSSVFHRKSHDVRGYSKLRVRFWYKSEKMEPGDSFVLEYSRSPGNWKVMKRFVRGENFDNGELKQVTVDFDGTGRNYGLTSRAKIRFRLDDASPNDFIYIDEVTFQGYVE